MTTQLTVPPVLGTESVRAGPLCSLIRQQVTKVDVTAVPPRGSRTYSESPPNELRPRVFQWSIGEAPGGL